MVKKTLLMDSIATSMGIMGLKLEKKNNRPVRESQLTTLCEVQHNVCLISVSIYSDDSSFYGPHPPPYIASVPDFERTKILRVNLICQDILAMKASEVTLKEISFSSHKTQNNSFFSLHTTHTNKN